MICPRCNANNDNNEQFCYNCGLRLEPPTPASEGAPTIIIPPPPQQATPPTYAQPSYNAPSYPPPVYDAPATTPPYPAPGYGQPAYGAPQQAYATVPTTSAAAIVSLIAGILCWLIPIGVGAIVAVVAGHIARGAIRRSNNTLGGGGMALAGLILGYLNLLVGVLLCALFVVVAAVGGRS